MFVIIFKDEGRARGGTASRRTITPEQQASMQAAIDTAELMYLRKPNAGLDRPAASAGTVGGLVRASGGSDAT